MKRMLMGAALFALSLGGCDTVKLYADLPKDKNVLFWTQDQRDNGFRALEKLATVRNIAAGGPARALGQGAPLKIDLDIDAYMASQRNAGLIIVQDGKVRFEKRSSTLLDLIPTADRENGVGSTS